MTFITLALPECPNETRQELITWTESCKLQNIASWHLQMTHNQAECSDQNYNVKFRNPQPMFHRIFTGSISTWNSMSSSGMKSKEIPCCFQINYFGIAPTATTAKRRSRLAHILENVFSLTLQYFIPKIWHRRVGGGKIEKSVFMQSVNYRWDHFCDYLHSDARALLECEEVGSVWRIIMDYSALFCALMILQKNGNHEMKWAARIMPISTVIYKFYRINFLFSFRRRPSRFFIPRFHFPDHAELAIKLRQS